MNSTTIGYVRSVFILAVVMSTALNGLFVQISHAQTMNSMTTMNTEMNASLTQLAQQPTTDTTIAQAWEVIQPRGVPPIYGDTLGISYDDPVAGMNIMRQYDPYKDPSIMSPNILARYINLGLMISCEYCCGAKTLVYDNGVAACGCAHSMAMRGLTRYLLEAYPSMTDTEIMTELVKWKSLYFPLDASKKSLKDTAAGTFNSDTYLINNVK